MPRLAAALLFGSLTTAGAAQAQWVELAFSTHPSARERHAMVFDLAYGETVLFGGYDGSYRNDTWTLGAAGWQLQSVTAPPGRADHALAYDPTRQRVVLLGGFDGAVELQDIWEWDGLSWAQLAATVPGVGQSGAACFDPVQGGVFYNRSTTNLLWDGVAATTVAVTQPLGGIEHQLVFDAASGGVLSVNGQSTRRFTVPQGWQDLNSSGYFRLRQYAMAIDPGHQRVLLHGGVGTVGSSNGPANDFTWEWTGVLWQLLAQPGQPSLSMNAMVFDPHRGFLMFGGRSGAGGSVDTTWRLQESNTPAAYQTFGQGCAGALPAGPRLQVDALWNATPVLGGVFLVRVDQLPPSQWTVGFLGTSHESWNGQALPLPLARLGMPGCELLVAPDIAVDLGIASAAGVAAWIETVPNCVGLLGLVFHQQAAVLAPGANLAGVLWSNAGQGIVGLR